MAFQCSCSGCAASCNSEHSGNWVNVTNRYLGLKFKIHGKVHYGWTRLSIEYVNGSFTEPLTGYAYETIPGKSIIAGQTKGQNDSSVEQPDSAAHSVPTPQPATLGALTLGSPGLPI